MQLTHLDLFSGIGGFALAAKANGVETVVFCENNDECHAFLEKTWGLPIVRDIRDFDGTKWRGCWLLTAGVPCQPSSRAGKRRGKEDDRWLWPEALRVLAEAKPTWCIFENPPGIDDVGLDGILAEMEGLGYEVQPFDIPACAVNSPQLRHRYYIVGHAESEPGSVLQRKRWGRVCDAGGSTQASYVANKPWFGSEVEPSESGARRESSVSVKDYLADGECERLEEPARQPEYLGAQCKTAERSPAIGLADSDSERRQGWVRPKSKGQTRRTVAGRASIENDLADAASIRREELQTVGEGIAESEGKCGMRQFDGIHRDAWLNYVWVPCADGKVRRAPDDSFVLVDGLHRSLLQGLGNSIVWPVAAEIIKAMIKSEQPCSLTAGLG